jgi:hypothetical protein
LVRPSTLRSTAVTELKGSPVLLAPKPARLRRADQLANQGEDEGFDTLMMKTADRPRRPHRSCVDTDDAHAERVAGVLGEAG